MKIVLVAASVFAFSSMAQQAQACDSETGERMQRVVLDWNHQQIDTWAAKSPAIHTVALPNGVQLGVQIEPQSIYKHEKSSGMFKYAPEMVKISLCDTSGREPKLLTYTFGGSNSIQGYGAQGGADSVAILGKPGVQLTLLKPVCEVVEEG
ncbi:hypothetical protein [Pseudomarimonas arenosa]|uniref:Uncharacterized protein n=1 Tax=Pseudomarimonas arenosa TaxID=2774145 RepID=A0AAW3ZPG8_9GAMM|nr:hypothetical protein [Pseudomarimonas arenosa]MBD8527079.1 hypothetical protein [Pseudomarimonas arenosa]